MTNYNVLASQLRVAERLGARLPKATSEAWERLTRVQAGSKLHRQADGPPLASIVADALEADRDLYTDPAVVAAVTRTAIGQQLNVAFAHEIEARTVRFSADHGDSILSALRKPFDAAAELLAAAFVVIGDVDLEEYREVLAMSGQAAQAWTNAAEAERVIRQVLQVRESLAQLGGVRSVAGCRTLAFADIPADAYINAGLLADATAPRPWEIVRRGWTLSLATFAEYATRVEAVTAERDRRRDLDATAGQRAWARTHQIQTA